MNNVFVCFSNHGLKKAAGIYKITLDKNRGHDVIVNDNLVYAKRMVIEMSGKSMIRYSFIVLLLSAVVLLVPNVSRAEWEFQESGVDDPNVIFLDVHFIDENNGWIVGNGSTIIRTRNGGETWEKQVCPVLYLAIEKVQFLNENTGYCCGTGYLFSTRDGGDTWTEVDLGFKPRSTWDLSFIDENTGWIVVEEALEGNKLISHVMYTPDGGKTWEKQLTYEHEMRGIDFYDYYTGWAIGSTYFDTFDHTDIFRTVDGGKSWECVSSDFGTKQKVRVILDDSLWIGYGGLKLSTDGGVTWQESLFRKTQIRPIEFQPLNCYETLVLARTLFTDDDEENHTKILLIDDQGTSFTELFSLPNSVFSGYSFSSIGKKVLWIAGADQKIVKFTMSTVSVDDKSGSFPRVFELLQNTPNPFNARTQISFMIFKSCHVIINIYDITGRKVKTVIDGDLADGCYSYVWDGYDNEGRTVTSGIYCYELTNGACRECKKMILVK